MLSNAGTDGSAPSAVETLATITSQEVKVGPLHLWVRSDLTLAQERMFEALEIPMPSKGHRLKNR